MEILLKSFLVVHVLAGSLALLSGLLALSLFGHPHKHRRVGQIFFYAMLGVFITAVVLSVVKSIIFLFAVGVLSFYSTYHGVRSMQFWKGRPTHWTDFGALVLLALSGLVLIGRAIMMVGGGLNTLVILQFVFGGFMMVLARVSFRSLRRLKPLDEGWFVSHRANMGGAIIATITAFCTTSLTFLPPLVAWLGPALVISPLLTWIIRISDRKYGIPTQRQN